MRTYPLRGGGKNEPSAWPGLERITGVSQTQLGHYLHGRRKPTKKTIAKIEAGVHAFAHSLTAVRFA